MELRHLSVLRLINLSHNNLSGRIPPCLKITPVEDVSGGYVDGLIALGPIGSFSFNEPIEFTTRNMSYSFKGRFTLPYMSGIDFSWNMVGEIPYEFGNFHKILVLNLAHNYLTGQIPPTFANLKRMESLDLSYNNLRWIIPPQLVRLTFLAYFNVSYNNLSGKTPTRVAQFGTFDESSYWGNPFLCGEPLPECGQPSSTPTTDDSEDNDLIDMGMFYVSFCVLLCSGVGYCCCTLHKSLLENSMVLLCGNQHHFLLLICARQYSPSTFSLLMGFLFGFLGEESPDVLLLIEQSFL